MTSVLQLALAQVPADADTAGVVADAAAAGADIVVFPEMFSNGYRRFDPDDPFDRGSWLKTGRRDAAPFLARMSGLAAGHRVHIVATLLEPASPAPFNTAVLIGPDGTERGRHRKVHICDFDSPECAIQAGDTFQPIAVETRAGPVTLGLLICMDREYAAGPAALSAAGAEVLLVPNCCDLATDAEVGDVRLAQVRGRAFETVTAIAVVNYPAPRADGQSIVVDARGRVVALAGRSPMLQLVEIDLDSVRAARKADHFRLQPSNLR